MSVFPPVLSAEVTVKANWRGVAIAATIIVTWFISLVFLLSRFAVQQTSFWISLAILWQTFLYTGLFITAHDAMHGIVCPNCPRLNYAIGTVTLLLYGWLSYSTLFKAHRQHHQYPATHLDPDFHSDNHSFVLLWYFQFMRKYWGLKNTLAITLTYHSLHHSAHVSESNLILFWALPALFSSFQLFYFGTFLPHREPIAGYTNSFRAQSIHRPFLLSLLTCYHFGYHYEHHQHPEVSWWSLPEIAQRRMDTK